MTLPPDRVPLQATVVLVGAGHAHLHVLTHADTLHRVGVRLVLVAPARFDYSGLATGVLSGGLPPGENSLDISHLAAAHRVEHHIGEAHEIDVSHRIVRLADGAEIAFDVLSLNIGSTVADQSGLAALPLVFPVKPLSQLAGLRREVERAAAETGCCPEIVVAGSGPSAYEISAAIAGLCERLKISPRIVVVGSAKQADWAPRAAHRALVRRLTARGVRFRLGVIAGRKAGACQVETGEQFPCDVLVLATGLRGAALAAESGLPVDGQGRLRVTNELHSIASKAVFAVGDCSVIVGDERPPLGVFGVRSGPVLLHNLSAAIQGDALSTYRPQSRWLSVLDLGDGTGLALWGRLWWLGRAPLWLKRWLDRKFLALHREA